MPDAHRAKSDVYIGEADPEKAQPRPEHMATVQAAHAGITLGARRLPGDFIHETANQMPQRMAAEGVTREQNHVHDQNQRPDADAEMGRAVFREPHRLPRVISEDENKQHRDIYEITVDILDDERKRTFAEKRFTRLTDGAIDRIGPERLVIRAAIIVAGEPKTCRRPQNQEGGRESGKPRRPPGRGRTEKRIVSDVNFRRMKPRKVILAGAS